MNMDHMFVMKLAALLFGGGIASCLFPGKSRMSHVLFLLLVLAETAVAHATIPDGWWFLLPGVVSVLLRLSFKGGAESGKGGKALLSLHATDGTIIRYYYWFSNFLVYGGAGSGKTKSIGKPLMEQYIRSGFAGFIYDFKDFDYTRTAYHMIRKHGYPHEFYYVNFTDMNRTYRFNPLDRRNIKAVSYTHLHSVGALLVVMMMDVFSCRVFIRLKKAVASSLFTGNSMISSIASSCARRILL